MTAVLPSLYNIADRLPCLERKRKLWKKYHYFVMYFRELLRLRYWTKYRSCKIIVNMSFYAQ
ncbi:hypothetical protein BCPG3_134 [Bacillus phage BCPG3]|nr:hypothetical protein BCPG3_134 [Bacillus phage BCPG3]QSJ04661.1 hypothetical protein BCP18_129 [Bacillus phage BCP18]